MTNQELAGKINAVNKANECATELCEQLIKFFAPYVGKPILKKDGTLLANIKKQLPDFPNTWALNVYSNPSNYSLSWVVKTGVNVPVNGGYSVAMYHETTVYVGKITGATLTELCEPTDFRSDYTLEELLKNREAAKIAKKNYADACSKCYPFGEN